MKYWAWKFVPTDMSDKNGDALYVYTKIRPSWYWFLRRVRLFLYLVCCRSRIDWRTAWKMSRVAKGITWKQYTLDIKKQTENAVRAYEEMPNG
jgi:hypothetical protein